MFATSKALQLSKRAGVFLVVVYVIIKHTVHFQTEMFPVDCNTGMNVSMEMKCVKKNKTNQNPAKLGKKLPYVCGKRVTFVTYMELIYSSLLIGR